MLRQPVCLPMKTVQGCETTSLPTSADGKAVHVCIKEDTHMALDVVLQTLPHVLVRLLPPSHTVEDQTLHGQGLYIENRRNSPFNPLCSQTSLTPCVTKVQEYKGLYINFPQHKANAQRIWLLTTSLLPGLSERYMYVQEISRYTSSIINVSWRIIL